MSAVAPSSQTLRDQVTSKRLMWWQQYHLEFPLWTSVTTRRLKWRPMNLLKTKRKKNLTQVPVRMKKLLTRHVAADMLWCRKLRTATSFSNTPRAGCCTSWLWSTTGFSNAVEWPEKNMRSPGRTNLDGILPVVEGVGVPQHRAWDPGLLEMDQTARALDPKGNKSSWAAWCCCDLM